MDSDNARTEGGAIPNYGLLVSKEPPGDQADGEEEEGIDGGYMEMEIEEVVDGDPTVGKILRGETGGGVEEEDRACDQSSLLIWMTGWITPPPLVHLLRTNGLTPSISG